MIRGNKNMEKFTVLVVDDTPIIIDVLHEVLKDDYNVKTAQDGKTALKAIRELKPDLVLLDVQLPDISGYAIYKEIKTEPELSKIPVILISGVKYAAQEAEGLDLGKIDYITKPAIPEVVLAKVKAHLG